MVESEINLTEARKFIVSLMTDAGEILRYTWKRFKPEILSRIILYPSRPFVGLLSLFRGGLRRVFQYGENRDLEWISPRNS